MPVSPAPTSRCLDSHQALTALPTTGGIAPETGDAGARPPQHPDPHGAAGVPATGFSTRFHDDQPAGSAQGPQSSRGPWSRALSALRAGGGRVSQGPPPEGPGPPPGCGGSALARRGAGEKGGRSEPGARGDPGRGGRSERGARRGPGEREGTQPRPRGRAPTSPHGRRPVGSRGPAC